MQVIAPPKRAARRRAHSRPIDRVDAPFATQILGDLGADIIKVEPESGDSLRGIGPFKSPGMGPMFFADQPQ